MLTIKQIIRIYTLGAELKFKKNSDTKQLKGECDCGALEAIIYTRKKSSAELETTILHELIHLRNETRRYRKNSKIRAKISEKYVEKEARETYKKNPYIIQFIKELYEIK